MEFEVLWYIVLGISILMYAMLDGFDLGVGVLHLFTRNDHQRRVFLNAIGPVWDGNEVWIVIVMGGLLAGFPNVYATLFSGFYTLFMALIAGFMFRAAAIEFRSKTDLPKWRHFWDGVFSLASHVVAFILGLLLGNMIQGIPVNAHQDYYGTLADFLRPYPILVGLTAVSLFAMHGAIYLAMKTEGETHDVVRRWISPAVITFIALYILTTISSLIYMPHMVDRFKSMPVLFIFPLIAFAAIINIFYQVRQKNDGWAFISSCVSIAFLLIIYGLGNFPIIVRSTLDPAYNITIYNSASSQKTLGALLLIVLIGGPFVVGYMIWIYRVFRGKVKLDKTSY